MTLSETLSHRGTLASNLPMKSSHQTSTSPGQAGFTPNAGLSRSFSIPSKLSTMVESSTNDTAKGVSRGGVVTPFPFKLHEMLESTHQEGIAHIVSWQPHGRCFVVHDPPLFVSTVMPQYFLQTKFASFQRQLNLYGFSRLTTGRDKGGYYHEHFLRSKPELVPRLTRQKIKGTKVRRAMTPGLEPSFYGMPFLPNSEGTNNNSNNKKKGPSTLKMNRRNSTGGAIPTFSSMPTTSTPSTASLSSLAPSSSSNKSTTLPRVASTVSLASHGGGIPTVASAASLNSMPEAFAAMQTTETSQQQASTEASRVTPCFTLSPTETKQPSPVASTQLVTSRSTGDLLFFEGKPFHYIDKEVMMKIRKPLALQPTTLQAKPTLQAPKPTLQAKPQPYENHASSYEGTAAGPFQPITTSSGNNTAAAEEPVNDKDVAFFFSSIGFDDDDENHPVDSSSKTANVSDNDIEWMLS